MSCAGNNALLLLIDNNIQVRLPNGSVLRHSFSPEATLNDVCLFITSNCPQLVSMQLVQVKYILQIDIVT